MKKKLAQLFEFYGTVMDTHVSKEKNERRVHYFFNRIVEDELFDKKINVVAVTVFEAILEKINDKLPYQEFVSLYICCHYFSYVEEMPEKYTLRFFYDYFDIFVLYIPFELVLEWENNTLNILEELKQEFVTIPNTKD